MALRWIEGFENRRHSDYWGRIYASYAGQTGDVTTAANQRKGIGASLSGTNAQFVTRTLVPSVENTWIIQWALRKDTDTAMGANTGNVMLRSGANDQVEVRWVAAASPDIGSYRLELRRGSTVLATSTVFLPSTNLKGWNVFQLKVTVRTGTNGVYELKGWTWDGVPFTVFSATSSVNTANNGTDGADTVAFRCNSGGTAEFAMDDIVIMDSTGSVNNDFTSVPIIVYGELPNADVGGELDWSASLGGNHFSEVDDGAGSPAGTDEVTSDVVGDVDLYGFSQAGLDFAPTGSPPTVLGIMVDVEALMKTSGSRTLRVRFKDSSNQADDSKDLTWDDTGKTSEFTVLEQNPTGTPAPWTIAVLKTIELGPKVTA
jgi:hypothetical protein